jgi:hypothetical protein
MDYICSSPADYLDVEPQQCVGWDDATGAARAARELGQAEHGNALALGHAGDRLVLVR